MRNKTKTLLSVIISGLGVIFLCNQTLANQINGSIAFNGSANFNNADLSSATAIISYNDSYTAKGQSLGDYSSIPKFTDAVFSPFAFDSQASPPVPLWTLTYNSITYSFNATSMTSSFDSVLNVWNIGGNGMAHIDGFQDTPGTWNLSAGAQGASFFFGSATAVAGVPDGGLTIALLGFALTGLEGLRRKLRK
jgi:protein with PEP-CTERM/exosortase system signal